MIPILYINLFKYKLIYQRDPGWVTPTPSFRFMNQISKMIHEYVKLKF